MINDNYPLISIGIPVYNCEISISECLQSLINQSYKNIEIIISDNCSTDNTFNICRQFQNTDSRIRLYRQDYNVGALNNFNFVNKKSNSDFFMWAAADDYWEKDFIKDCFIYLSRCDDCVAVITKTKFGDNEKIYSGDSSIESSFVIFRRLKFIINPGPNARFYSLYKNVYLRKLQINNYNYFAGDWAFIFDLLKYGNFIKIGKEIGFTKRILDSSESNTKKIIKNLKDSNKSIYFPLSTFTKHIFFNNPILFLFYLPAIIYQNFVCIKWLILNNNDE